MNPGSIVLQARTNDSDAVVGALVAFAGVFFLALVRRLIRKNRRAAAARSRPAPRPAQKPAPFIRTTHPVIVPAAGAASSRSVLPIESVRQLMGEPPRTFDASLEPYLEVLPPKWLLNNTSDDMWINIKNQQRLRREGMVVWGAVVQANSNLFKKINNESGASVIYSADAWFDRNPTALRIIAQQCFALKGKDPDDPESATFARMLTNEMSRAPRLKVPGVFTDRRQVFHSSMLMPRKHLPKGILSGTLFPVWMDRQETGAVVMVPAAYWPASLTADWDRE